MDELGGGNTGPIRQHFGELRIRENLASVPPPVKNALDGASLLPLISGQSKEAPHEAFFWRVGPKNAVREGGWKLLRDGGSAWRLYHLETDIGETEDLAAKEPGRVQEMTARWDAWEKAQVAALWR